MSRFRSLPFVPLLVLAGCYHAPAPSGGPPLPVVPVSRPVERLVTDTVDYTGRTGAVQALDVRARVTGYLVQMPFKEGGEVKKGDLLFEIDPRPYKDLVDAARAQLALAEANLRLARVTYERDRVIAARDPGGVSQQQLDQDLAQQQVAQASVAVARANLNSAELNLEWTRVTSPIDGVVSRYYYTLGNLVVQDQTLLTTVVSVDPIYAYFDVDENTVLRIREAINAGRIIPQANTEDIQVLLGVGTEEGYPHIGHVSFFNNTVNPSTGTLAVRGTFPNPKPVDVISMATDTWSLLAQDQSRASLGTGPVPYLLEVAAAAATPRPLSRRVLSPGMFARIRVPIGQARPTFLVADQAVGSDQGLKFVYVVDGENKVQYRRVTTGALQDDGLRVILDGVKADDRVVVGALQQVRPRMEVEPDEMPMPALGTPATGTAPPPVPDKPQPPPSAPKS
jgi:multidrug efflux system membrane fusion protein